MAAVSRAVRADGAEGASRAASWPVAVREFCVSGYRAVALAGEPEMRAEWEAMRNFTLEHVAACRLGKHRALSLRDRDTGERVATVLLQRQGGRYALLDARRRFNRPVDAQLWAAAERAAAVYGGACAAQPVRRATACRRGDRGEHAFAAERLTGSQRPLDFGA